jgi:hypothetical protein
MMHEAVRKVDKGHAERKPEFQQEDRKLMKLMKLMKNMKDMKTKTQGSFKNPSTFIPFMSSCWNPLRPPAQIARDNRRAPLAH